MPYSVSTDITNVKDKRPAKLKFLPKGFSSFTANCGIKDDSLDLGIIFSDVACSSAAFFTTNQVQGEPIKIGRKHILEDKLQAVVVNSKNANVGTGKTGYHNCLEVCSKVSEELKIPMEAVIPSSTGVIGVELPIEKIKSRLNNLKHLLKRPAMFDDFARSIMTTDTFPKYISAKLGDVNIVAVAKGAGMLEPNIATMLSYFFTDAKISSRKLHKIWRPILQKTFNSLSIDTDTSTSDTLLCLANGLSGVSPSDEEFAQKIEEMATQLTRWIAMDAEGATKLFIVDVNGAKNDTQAKAVGKSIINSPLVKTAIYQGDPNWGRVLMAIGKTKDVQLKPEHIELQWGELSVNSKISALHAYLKNTAEIHLTVRLGVGEGSWRVYGCDLTEEYVKINAYYTT